MGTREKKPAPPSTAHPRSYLAGPPHEAREAARRIDHVVAMACGDGQKLALIRPMLEGLARDLRSREPVGDLAHRVRIVAEAAEMMAADSDHALVLANIAERFTRPHPAGC